jgi:hypothetical protein
MEATGRALLTQCGIFAGTTIPVIARGASNGIFPHRTEDVPIDPASSQVGNGVASGFKFGGPWRFERQEIARWIRRKVDEQQGGNRRA